MIDFIQQYSPVTQALFATLFTWGVAAAGAALVFCKNEINPKHLDCMLGFAAGVMIAASFWSLLAPGIEMAEQMGQIPWLTAVVGFMGGGIFMRLTDKFLPHLHPGLRMDQSEGVKTSCNAVLCWFWPSPCTIFLKVWPLVLPLALSHLACLRLPSVEQSR
jgi:ZIP family zinc transporter